MAFTSDMSDKLQIYHTSVAAEINTWCPNHFVPLLFSTAPDTEAIDVYREEVDNLDMNAIVHLSLHVKSADLTWRDKCILTFLVTTKDELLHNGVHI